LDHTLHKLTKNIKAMKNPLNARVSESCSLCAVAACQFEEVVTVDVGSTALLDYLGEKGLGADRASKLD
jgi:hypothetical protein